MKCLNPERNDKDRNQLASNIQIAIIGVWLIVVNLLFFWSRLRHSSLIQSLLD